MNKGNYSGLSEVQKAIAEAGMSPYVISYPDEINTHDYIMIMMRDIKELIKALRAVVKQRDLAISQIQHSCTTCKHSDQHSNALICVECNYLYSNWSWIGYKEETK